MRRFFGFTKKSSAVDKEPERSAPSSSSSSFKVADCHESRRETAPNGIDTDGRGQQASTASAGRSRDIPRQVAFVSPPASSDSSTLTLKPSNLHAGDDIRNSFIHRPATSASNHSTTASGHYEEASLPSPPLSGARFRDTNYQGSSSRAPFPSYPSSAGPTTRSTTPAGQQQDAAYRSISPVSNTTIGGLNYPWNRQQLLTQSLGGRAGPEGSSTALQAPLTWADLADPDLVDNLGGRERTRQEVLWEIVASEERYVHELISLVEHYVNPLLHPGKPSSPATPSPIINSLPSNSPRSDQSRSPDMDLYQTHQPRQSTQNTMSSGTSMRRDSSHSMTDASDVLPIAARFARTLGGSQDSGLVLPSNSSKAPQSHRQASLSSQHSMQHIGLGIDPATIPSIEDDADRAPQPSEDPNLQRRVQHKSSMTQQRPPTSQSRYHQPSSTSLKGTSPPAPPSRDNGFAKAQNTFRHHLKSLGPPSHNKLHRSDKAVPQSERAAPRLPEPLKILLTVIMEHLLGRHEQLSALLQERWVAQYPLVRSLSDIWVEQTWLIQDYGVYVLHLEKSLQIIEDVMATVHPQRKQKHFSEEEKEKRKLAKQIIKLEERAGAIAGESSLAICLSKPFQRLLKYPLLFQNLLYHTDASTIEYEGTQQLALEIDRIVRSIESEKVSEEERDCLRDLFARIDHINDKALMVPLKERFLLEEFPIWGSKLQSRSHSDVAKQQQQHQATYLRPPQPSDQTAGGKSKKAVRRFSDMMTSSEGDKKVPNIGSKKDIWIIRLSDVVLRCQRVGVTTRPLGAVLTKDAKGRKNSGPRRNLYRFLSVERWEPQLAFPQTNVAAEADDTAGEEQEDLEPQGEPSRMSFSYTDDEPRPVLAPLPLNGTRTFYGTKEEAANPKFKRDSEQMKFGNRLRQGAGPATPAMRAPTPSAAPLRRRAYEAPTTAYLGKIRPAEKRTPEAPPSTASTSRMTESTSTGSLAHSSSAAQLYATYSQFVDPK